MIPKITSERWRDGIYSIVDGRSKKIHEKYIYEHDLLNEDEELEFFASKHLFNLRMAYAREDRMLILKKFKEFEESMEKQRKEREKNKTDKSVFQEPSAPHLAEKNVTETSRESSISKDAPKRLHSGSSVSESESIRQNVTRTSSRTSPRD
ncbi:hypothetical protein NPIL_407601 [Nephila pilipes]|uniref:Uncharacterized protein n=1 Tax=Nephila pilipes TaxID=299642 RepID=A0A8X6TYT7_NEPPI|nr:hypothetical protein NPIL_407601 [Nephila pilipes]